MFIDLFVNDIYPNAIEYALGDEDDGDEDEEEDLGSEDD
jgi:hypothetical protein